MCIAIHAPREKELSRESLEICWENNNDGAGFMFAHDGELYVHKELVSFNSFYKHYKKMYDKFGAESPFVVHFRIRTHGEVDLVNCHPHMVNDNLGFAHNGILSKIVVPVTSDLSDTILFNQTILQQLPPLALNNPAVISLLKSFCSGNKLVFLDNQGNSLIVNKNLGEEDNGIWYSNTSYKTTRWYTGKKKKTAYKSKGRGWTQENGWDWEEYEDEYPDQKKKDFAVGEALPPIEDEGPYCDLCEINELSFPVEFEYGICIDCCDRLGWVNFNDDFDTEGEPNVDYGRVSADSDEGSVGEPGNSEETEITLTVEEAISGIPVSRQGERAL